MWFLFLTKGEESQTQVCFSNKPILLEEVFRYVHEKLTKNMIFCYVPLTHSTQSGLKIRTWPCKSLTHKCLKHRMCTSQENMHCWLPQFKVSVCVYEREREREKRLSLLRQSLLSFPLKLSPTVCLEEWTESAKLWAGMASTASGTGKKRGLSVSVMIQKLETKTKTKLPIIMKAKDN